MRFLHSFTTPMVALSLACLGTLGSSGAAIAAVFGQKEVDQTKFEVIASPFGANSYQLLILEQLNNQRPCWSASGSNPTIVDPLLLQFDFTGICGRSTDSNGYSVRLAGRDFGLSFDLSVVRRDNDLVLIATNISNRRAEPLIVGRTNGIPPAGQFAKINLAPGWRITKRTKEGTELGHVYLTSDTLPEGITLSAFADTQSHWARAYIDALAARGIVSGFSEDNSFRPDDPVTRVQFAAIVNKAFANLPPTRSGTSFKDVQSNFWGYQAIQTAYQKGFMSGYPDNTFKPNQSIPRVEVLVSLTSGLKYPSVDPGLLAFYNDAGQIPSWANGAIAAATAKKIVVNFPRVKELNPNRTATRAEVAAFVYQALVDAGQLPVIPSPYVAGISSTTPTAPSVAPTLNAPTPSPNPGETPVAPGTPPSSTTPAPTTPSPAAPAEPQIPAPAPATPAPQSQTPAKPNGFVVPVAPVTP